MLTTGKLVNQLKFFPLRHSIAMSAILIIVITSSLVLPSKVSSPQVLLNLNLNHNFTDNKPTPANDLPDIHWRDETVAEGDSLALIFNRVGLSNRLLLNLINKAPDKNSLLKLKPREKFRFGYKDDELTTIQYIQSPLDYIEIAIASEGFDFQRIVKEPEVRLQYKHITINDSLFLSASKAGINDNITMEIANIFGGVIDFALDVRPGDSFDILYEHHYLNDTFIGYGNILSASYTNNGKTYTAYRFQLDDGSVAFFDADGTSMRKAFLRAPLDFTRISSGFNLRRKHPIHKKIKAHRGIDYAAPTGTPIFAAGDGRVTKSGYNKANGNYVFIKHGQKYTTKYIHLHKRKVKTGQRVKQRDVIGTVGSTGYATGPHLHYEFLINGVHRNPRTVIRQLPAADPIPKAQRPRFLEKIRTIQLQYQNFQSQQISEK